MEGMQFYSNLDVLIRGAEIAEAVASGDTMSEDSRDSKELQQQQQQQQFSATLANDADQTYTCRTKEKHSQPNNATKDAADDDDGGTTSIVTIVTVAETRVRDGVGELGRRCTKSTRKTRSATAIAAAAKTRKKIVAKVRNGYGARKKGRTIDIAAAAAKKMMARTKLKVVEKRLRKVASATVTRTKTTRAGLSANEEVVKVDDVFQAINQPLWRSAGGGNGQLNAEKASSTDTNSSKESTLTTNANKSVANPSGALVAVTRRFKDETPICEPELICPSLIYDDGEAYDDPTGMLPGTEDYPGPLNFQLFLNTEDKSKRSWLYSILLRKLYIDINKIVCVQFKLKTPTTASIDSSKETFLVRALPVYAAPEFLQEPVSRCPVHVMTDKANGHSNVPWLYHVLRAEHHEAVYHINRKSHRHSVVVPLHSPTLGSEFVTIMYKFSCKTSCAFGLNRRPVHVIFTLETSTGEIIGRRKLLVKVCSCPKRDLHRDELVSKSEIDANGRKRRIKEVDNSLSYSSMEIYSPPTKEIKMEHIDEEENLDEDAMVYTIPELRVAGKQNYISTLEMLHGHFLGISVRHDSLLDMHPNISRVAELLESVKKYKENGHRSDVIIPVTSIPKIIHVVDCDDGNGHAEASRTSVRLVPNVDTIEISNAPEMRWKRVD